MRVGVIQYGPHARGFDPAGGPVEYLSLRAETCADGKVLRRLAELFGGEDREAAGVVAELLARHELGGALQAKKGA